MVNFNELERKINELIYDQSILPDDSNLDPDIETLLNFLYNSNKE